MPTYDYQCQTCQHAFTAMHKISDPKPACPECGGEARKLLSAPAVGGKKPQASNQGCQGACACKH